MSVNGRKDHLKKIQEFKEYVWQSSHPQGADILSQDPHWKHGVNLDKVRAQPAPCHGASELQKIASKTNEN